MLTPRIPSARATVSSSIRHSVFSRRWTSRRAISRSTAIFERAGISESGGGIRFTQARTEFGVLISGGGCEAGNPSSDQGVAAEHRARRVIDGALTTPLDTYVPRELEPLIRETALQGVTTRVRPDIGPSGPSPAQHRRCANLTMHGPGREQP